MYEILNIIRGAFAIIEAKGAFFAAFWSYSYKVKSILPGYLYHTLRRVMICQERLEINSE